MSGRVITYTKDELLKFNVYSMRKIPEGDRYHSLRQFVSDEKSVNLSNVVKQPMIPTYLKNRYGDIQMGSGGSGGGSSIKRGNFHDQHEASRRKLYTQKSETIADHINEEVRDLLSKLSDGNKDKLLNDFMKKDIPDECGQVLIDNIYTFAVDISYLIHIYVELIFLLEKKNSQLYQRLIDKITSSARAPLPEDPDGKRLRLGNILLIAEIYKQRSSVIDIISIIKHLLTMISPQTPDYIHLLSELLKKVNTRGEVPYSVIEQIHTIEYDKAYDKRYRFMVQDIIELYNEDEDEDSKINWSVTPAVSWHLRTSFLLNT